MGTRWSVEQVAAIAPTPAALAAAEPLTADRRWATSGCDARAVWGRCLGSGAEPYDTMVDHTLTGAGSGWRCTCPSRRQPCKHALALLLRWVRGGVPEAGAPPAVARWLARRGDAVEAPADVGPDTAPGAEPSPSGDSPDAGDDGPPAPPAGPDRDALDRSRDDRVARMLAGLADLDRWLADRMRNGLADPALARYDTWDTLAARLVDARAGALANRVRRLAGLVGASPDWHSDVLAELGTLHLLAQAGSRIGALPGALADAAATAAGWQVRQADVLATAPDTDDWLVAGRSDHREDRIEVRRVWLYGTASRRWAMLLSFAAYQQVLDDSFTVGTLVRAEIHRYPGGSLRALAGRRDADPLALGATAQAVAASALDVTAACDAIGRAVAAEPWLERFPATVRATPTREPGPTGRWLLADSAGAVPLADGTRPLAMLLAASAGSEVVVTVEWTPRGVVPLTVHLPDRAVDVGPRADPTFVGRA